MSTRIIFNGQEYASPDDMPEDVRKAYQAVLDTLVDRDGDGMPDGLKSDGRNVVAVHQSAITFKSPLGSVSGALPPSLGWLGELAGRLGERAEGEVPKAPPEAERLVSGLDSTTSALGNLLLIIAGVVAGAAIVGAAWIIIHMDEGSRSQGGAFFVGAGALLVLGWAVSMMVKLYRK